MTPKQSRNSRVVVVALVVASFFAGMTARGFAGNASPSSVERRAKDASAEGRGPSGAGPATYHDGIPAGFARTEAGARAAAVAYVLTGQLLINLGPSLVDDAVQSMAASASADVQVTAAHNQLDRLRQVLAAGTGPIRYVQAVIATRVDAFAPDRARVSAWNVGVLSRAGVAAPQAGWTTSVLDLVWERGDWKIWGETITPGPAPALNAGVAPATSEQLDTALDGFTPWEPSR